MVAAFEDRNVLSPRHCAWRSSPLHRRANHHALATSGDPYRAARRRHESDPDVFKRRSAPRRQRRHRAGQMANCSRSTARYPVRISCEGGRHRHRPLQEQPRAERAFTGTASNWTTRRRHAADPKHRAAGRHDFKVQGHASGRLLVSPASPFSTNGVQGRSAPSSSEHQRGDIAGVRRSPARVL